MKDFSHPGAGEKTPVDINKAIESTITVTHNEWKYVAELEAHLDKDLPLVPCLPGDFNQVILNIIINAAHAIGNVIDENADRKGTISVSTGRNNGWAEVRIQDTGSGIPEAYQPRIFDPFFTTKEVGRGTGQGLAISRSVIVDKHGGSLNFETTEGKGTTFIIRLPLE
jgi:signal transduction histidine kinase